MLGEDLYVEDTENDDFYNGKEPALEEISQ